MRKLLPPDRLDEFHDVKPTECSHCGTALWGEDRHPVRHQVTELPPVEPVVREYRLHALKCRACGQTTRAELPKGVPRGSFGPRLHAMVALFSGAYRLSRRNVKRLLADTFGVEISLGAISKLEGSIAQALAAPHRDALGRVRRARVAHADETSWRERRTKSWLWTAVTRKATVYLVRASRGACVARELLGKRSRGHLVSDRCPSYGWVETRRRQVCWSHLIRDFRKIALSGKEAEPIGECLEAAAQELFGHWYRVRDGTMKRATFQRYAIELRRRIRRLLELGGACNAWRAPSLCRGILELEPAMWNFVKHEGIEPTNNVAERMIRPGVLWRKTSLGSQSERGSRFVERLLTCVANLRQQERNVLEYLTSVTTATLRGALIPALLN